MSENKGRADSRSNETSGTPKLGSEGRSCMRKYHFPHLVSGLGGLAGAGIGGPVPGAHSVDEHDIVILYGDLGGSDGKLTQDIIRGLREELKEAIKGWQVVSYDVSITSRAQIVLTAHVVRLNEEALLRAEEDRDRCISSLLGIKSDYMKDCGAGAGPIPEAETEHDLNDEELGHTSEQPPDRPELEEGSAIESPEEDLNDETPEPDLNAGYVEESPEPDLNAEGPVEESPEEDINDETPEPDLNAEGPVEESPEEDLNDETPEPDLNAEGPVAESPEEDLNDETPEPDLNAEGPVEESPVEEDPVPEATEHGLNSTEETREEGAAEGTPAGEEPAQELDSVLDSLDDDPTTGI